MKLYYPYFNLFYKKGTTNYTLETLVKMPGNCIVDAIEQSFINDYWEVRIKLKEQEDSLVSEKEKMEDLIIALTQSDVRELEKIVIVVKNYDNLLRNGDSDGEGITGLGSGEIE